MKVFYDLSRLVERMHAGHATGVDRVDLRYALWTRARANEWRGVVQRSNGFVLLKEDYVDTLLEHLSWGWLGSGVKRTTSILEQPTGWRRESRRALREKLTRVSFGAVVAERGFAVALWSRLSCFSYGSCARWEGSANAMYVNIGHCFRFESALGSIPDNIRRLYFLHDVIPLTHSEYQKATSAAHFKKFCEYVGHPKSNVMVSSRATVTAIETLRNDERKHFDSVASVKVLPLAVEDRFKAEVLDSDEVTVSKGNSAKGYFLSVGTVEPRKNLELLVQLWEQLIESGRSLPKLIWVGKFGWSADKALMRRFAKLEQRGLVELRSGVSDDALIALMKGAIALLFPSKVEGWGLPLSEALAMGVPVIASKIAVFEAVGQGVPELIELDDLNRWKSMILNYAATDSNLRMLQMQRIKCYQPLTWTQHFEGFEALWGSLRS